MASEPLSGEARVQSWRVFALVLLSASYFFQSSGHNEASHFDQIRSVAERGAWWIDGFSRNTGDVVSVNGHTYPNKAPGMTWLGVLPWKAARAVFSALPVTENQQLVLVTYALTVLMSALPTALVSLLLLRLLARSGLDRLTALLISLGYGLSSLAFPFATLFFSHQLATGFAFGGFYWIWDARSHSATGARFAQLFAAGLLLGFLPVIEYPGALASGLIVLYSLSALRGDAWPVLAGAVLGVLPLPLYNILAFGDVLSLGYSYYKPGTLYAAHAQGLMGVTWPSLEVLAQITVRAKRGLFYANPWLVFAPLALIFWRDAGALKREVVLAVSICAAFLTFNAGFGDSIVYWGGAFSLGPRHLLVALPFMAILVSLPLRRPRLRPIIVTLIAVTSLLMLVSTSADPRLPYEPPTPFVDFYLPSYFRGFISVYPWGIFGDAPLFASSGAFNLGRVAGLPHSLEMMPLGLLWLFASWKLFRDEPRPTRMAAWTSGICGVVVALIPTLGPSAEWRSRGQGVCRSLSPGQYWDYLGDNSLQADLPHSRKETARVFDLTKEEFARVFGDAGGGSSSSQSYYEPAAEGWYIFTLSSVGPSALYVDGLHRMKIDAFTDRVDSRRALIFLSKRPHELVVRHMSDTAVGLVSVSVTDRAGAPISLDGGLSHNACGADEPAR